MKHISILLCTIFVLTSCATTQTPSTQNMPAQDRPVQNTPGTSGLVFPEPIAVPEKIVIDDRTQAFIDANLVGTWSAPDRAGRKVQIKNDNTFQFNINEEVFVVGDINVIDEKQLILIYGENPVVEIELDIVKEGEGYRLLNTEEGENFVK